MTDANQPPLPPAAPPAYPYAPPTPTGDGRPVSFYVAIFLALLLFVSGGLNLLLLVVSALGSAAGPLGGSYGADQDGMYELVTVAGDPASENGILRVPVEGAIAEASSPLIGASGGTVSQVRRALRAAERDELIRGVLFDINSPGGGVTDSDEIHRLIRKFRARNTDTPVVALFGDIAASGGYYIAAACDVILARPTTITGSIGVIINNLNYAGALEKIGVTMHPILSDDTPYKDMLSPTRPMRPEEEAKVKAIVQEMYERFVDIVDEGRPDLSRADVKAAATGEIFSAERALSMGLVDDIVSLDGALDWVGGKLGVADVRVIEQRRIPTFIDMLAGAGATAPSLDAAAAQLLRASSGPRLLYYWQGGR